MNGVVVEGGEFWPQRLLPEIAVYGDGYGERADGGDETNKNDCPEWEFLSEKEGKCVGEEEDGDLGAEYYACKGEDAEGLFGADVGFCRFEKEAHCEGCWSC